MNWSQRMVEAQRCAMPTASSADCANRPAEMANCAIGTIGKGMSSSAAYPVGKQSALLALTTRGLADLAPCPADVAERAAIIAEGDRCDHATADARALAEHGIESWAELAERWRSVILPKLDRLPTLRLAAQRLLATTRNFLEQSLFVDGVRSGWTMPELFGVHETAPFGRLDALGVVAGLALTRLDGLRLVSLEDSAAVFVCRDGSRLVQRRGARTVNCSVPWWECSAIVRRQSK